MNHLRTGAIASLILGTAVITAPSPSHAQAWVAPAIIGAVIGGVALGALATNAWGRPYGYGSAYAYAPAYTSYGYYDAPRYYYAPAPVSYGYVAPPRYRYYDDYAYAPGYAVSCYSVRRVGPYGGVTRVRVCR